MSSPSVATPGRDGAASGGPRRRLPWSLSQLVRGTVGAVFTKSPAGSQPTGPPKRTGRPAARPFYLSQLVPLAKRPVAGRFPPSPPAGPRPTGSSDSGGRPWGNLNQVPCWMPTNWSVLTVPPESPPLANWCVLAGAPAHQVHQPTGSSHSAIPPPSRSTNWFAKTGANQLVHEPPVRPEKG